MGYLLMGKSGQCLELTNSPPSCAEYLEILGISNFWSTNGLSRPVIALLYLHKLHKIAIFYKVNIAPVI